jgi:hypothetical protein
MRATLILSSMLKQFALSGFTVRVEYVVVIQEIFVVDSEKEPLKMLVLLSSLMECIRIPIYPKRLYLVGQQW